MQCSTLFLLSFKPAKVSGKIGERTSLRAASFLYTFQEESCLNSVALSYWCRMHSINTRGTATPPRFTGHSMLRTALACLTKFCLLHPALKPLGTVSGKTTDDQIWVEGSGQV